MSAVIGSLTDSVAGSNSQKSVRFGSVEPAILALLKHLDPLIAVVTLVLCSFVFDQRPTPAIAGVAVLTFMIASGVFNPAKRESGLSAGKPLSSVYSRIVLEWSCVVAILLFAAFALKVTELFSRLVMIMWFVATPVALCVAHALRRRLQNAIAANGHAQSYIIIGVNSVGFELFRRLPRKGFLGFFDFRSPDRFANSLEPGQFVGHCKDVADFARRNGRNGHLRRPAPEQRAPHWRDGCARCGIPPRPSTSCPTCSPSISSRVAWSRSTACRHFPFAIRRSMAWMR
ncbi:MAG: hypothetical protein WDO56_21735 [Gammaproteobacteria bacterium]